MRPQTTFKRRALSILLQPLFIVRSWLSRPAGPYLCQASCVVRFADIHYHRRYTLASLNFPVHFLYNYGSPRPSVRFSSLRHLFNQLTQPSASKSSLNNQLKSLRSCIKSYIYIGVSPFFSILTAFVWLIIAAVAIICWSFIWFVLWFLLQSQTEALLL